MKNFIIFLSLLSASYSDEANNIQNTSDEKMEELLNDDIGKGKMMEVLLSDSFSEKYSNAFHFLKDKDPELFIEIICQYAANHLEDTSLIEKILHIMQDNPEKYGKEFLNLMAKNSDFLYWFVNHTESEKTKDIINELKECDQNSFFKALGLSKFLIEKNDTKEIILLKHIKKKSIYNDAVKFWIQKQVLNNNKEIKEVLQNMDKDKLLSCFINEDDITKIKKQTGFQDNLQIIDQFQKGKIKISVTYSKLKESIERLDNLNFDKEHFKTVLHVINAYSMKGNEHLYKKLQEKTKNFSDETQKRILPIVLNCRLADEMLFSEDSSILRMGEFFIPKSLKPRYSDFNVDENGYIKLEKDQDFETISLDWGEEFKNNPEKMKRYNEQKTQDEKNIKIDQNDIDWSKSITDQASNNPVGYYLHIPKNKEIKAVLVHVYGGFQVKDLEKQLNNDVVSNFDQAFLSKGIAVAKLNLSDLYKNNDFQGRMKEEMFKEVLKGIYGFIDKFKTGKLDKKLADLKDKKVFLYGASFGGLTVTRFLEEYPETVDGAISWCGSVVNNRHDQNDNFIAHLNKKDISKIQKPILLLASSHDNRVMIKEAITDFYKMMENEGKANLVSSYITENSNFNLGHQKDVYYGHFEDEKDYDLFKVIENFVVRSQKDETLEKLRILNANERYKAVNNDFSTFNEECIASALRNKKRPMREGETEIPGDEWNNYYGPLYFEVLARRQFFGKFGYKENINIQEENALCYELFEKNSLQEWINTNLNKQDLIKVYQEKLIKKLTDMGFKKDNVTDFVKQYAEHYVNRQDDQFIKKNDLFYTRHDLYLKSLGKLIFEKLKNNETFQKKIKEVRITLESYFKNSGNLLGKKMQEISQKIKIKQFNDFLLSKQKKQ